MVEIDFSNVADFIKTGHIGVMPTDTIYGVVGSALSSEVVERIYAVKERLLHKPFIILIAAMSDLNLFGVSPDGALKIFLEENWPGKVSVIIDGIGGTWNYLHRGRGSLAFRLPDKKELTTLLKETGPLVAPSANPEGKPPAHTIAEAKEYFGEQVDFYIDGGELRSEPSTLVEYCDGTFKTLRQGSV